MRDTIEIMRFGHVEGVSIPIRKAPVLPRPAPFGEPFGDFLPVLLQFHFFRITFTLSE